MPGIGLPNALIVGREEDIAELDRILEEVKLSKGRFVFITGEAGVGKSRLVRELEGRHWEEDLLVLKGRCQYIDRADPYYPIKEMLLQARDLLPPEGVGQRELLPMALWAGKGMTPDSSPRHMGLILVGGDDQHDDISSRISSAFLELSKRGVVLMVIENLQWADRATLDFLRRFGEEISQRPIMFICTYEFEELPASQSPLIDTVKHLRSKGLASFIKVKRLSKEEVRTLLTEALGQAAFPQQVVDALFERTMGNPYLLKEAISSISEGSKDPLWYTKMDLERIKVPANLGDVMAQRIKRIREEDRKVLYYASVLGTRFHLDELADLLGQRPEALLPAIGALTEMRLLRLDTSEQAPAYLFENPLVKEIAYTSLTKSRRRVLHAKIGELIEARNLGDPSKVIFDLAYHFFRGGNDEKALKYLVIAGERSMEVGATQDAIGYFTQAEEALGRSPAKAQDVAGNLYFDLGWTKDLIGDWQKATEYYSKALGIAVAQKDPRGQARVLSGMAQISRRRGLWDNAAADYRKIIDILKGSEEHITLAETYRQLGEVTLRKGDEEKALPYLEEAIRYAKMSRSTESMGTVMLQVGNLYNFKGDLDRSLEYYERGLDLLLKTQNADRQIVGYGNIGDIYLQRNDLGKALDYFRHAERIAAQTGNAQRLGFVKMNISEALAKNGDIPGAKLAGEESLAILRRLDDKIGVASTLKNLGLVHARSGELGLAEQYFKQAIDMLRSLGTPYNLAQALSEHADVLERAGRLDEARAVLEESLALFESIGSIGPTKDAKERLARMSSRRKAAKDK